MTILFKFVEKEGGLKVLMIMKKIIAIILFLKVCKY